MCVTKDRRRFAESILTKVLVFVLMQSMLLTDSDLTLTQTTHIRTYTSRLFDPPDVSHVVSRIYISRTRFSFIHLSVMSSETQIRAKFIPPQVQENETGWGPCRIPEQYSDLPYQPFSKSDRIGKVSSSTDDAHVSRRNRLL